MSTKTSDHRHIIETRNSDEWPWMSSCTCGDWTAVYRTFQDAVEKHAEHRETATGRVTAYERSLVQMTGVDLLEEYAAEVQDGLGDPQHADLIRAELLRRLER